MTDKIILFSALLAYSIIVSQSFMYILALRTAQLNLEAHSYIELRKLIDTSMRSNFKYVVYTALLTNLILVIVTSKHPESLIFISATVAFIALVADTIITVKGNLPVNDIINSWSRDHYPKNWTDYRLKWLRIFQYRQIANITGFLFLLAGAIFSK